MISELTFRLNTLISNSDVSINQEVLLRKAFIRMSDSEALRALTFLESNPTLISSGGDILERMRTQPKVNFQTILSQSTNRFATV